MKPLACEPGSGSHKNNNYNSEIKSFKDNIHLIGVLSPGKNKEHKSWLVIETPTPTELSSLYERLQEFGSFCPKKFSTFCLHCINNHWNTKAFIGKELLRISSNIGKENSAIDDKLEILLIPVDEMSGEIMIENCVRVDREAFTFGKSDNFHLPAITISDSQERTAFVDLNKIFTSNFVNTRSENIEQGNGKESKQLGIFKGENQNAESSRQLITIRNDKILGSTTERGKPIKTKSDNSKIKRMISFCNSQSNDGIHKRNKKSAELGSGLKGTGTETENYPQQLIRIELKPDPRMQDKTIKYYSGDKLRLKVTIPEVEHCDYQVEFDLVKSFQCKTISQNSCRSRRITKVLKRTIVTDLKWESAIHISGQQFSLVWILYKIPELTEDEIVTETRNGDNTEDKPGYSGEPSDKFTVSECLYELQVLFYEKVINPGCEEKPHHNGLAAGSSFPLGLLEKATADTNDNESTLMSGLHTSRDAVQACSGVGKKFQEIKTKECFENKPLP